MVCHALVLVTCVAAQLLPPVPRPDVDGMIHILTEFEAAAKANGNSRSVAKGFNDSAAYVLHRLREHQDVFVVQQQHFTVPVWTEVEPPTLDLLGATPPIPLQRCRTRTGWQHYERACDYSGVRYGGHNDAPSVVAGNVTEVQYPCDSAGFFDFPRGNIALFTATSECTIMTMITNAQTNGAAAVLLATHSGPPFGGQVMDPSTWVEGTVLPVIPTIGITAPVKGTILQLRNQLKVRVATNQRIALEKTFNIFASTKQGDLNKVAMIGAHLDSVPEGPGINDNGSGSAMILQLATQWAAQMRKAGAVAARALRFAWWGAEEIGLMGSRYYVSQLVQHYPEELAKIQYYLNFDMEAGPNYIRFVHDGNTAPNPDTREASMKLTNAFTSTFTSLGLSYGYTGLTGGSDFLPFILAGVPAGGLATGAAAVKTQQEASEQGGLANAPLDPCYHAPCDTVQNVNRQCLQECGACLAGTLTTLLSSDFGLSAYHRPNMTSSKLQAMFQQHRQGFEMSCDGKEVHHDGRGRDEL